MGLESYLIRLSPGCRYFIKVIQFITSGLHYYYNKVSEKNMGFISKVYPYLSEKDREALMEDKVASMRLNALFKKIDEHLTYIDSNSSPNSAELKKLGVRGIDMVEQHHLDVSYLTLGQIPQTLLSLREKEEACSAGYVQFCLGKGWRSNQVDDKVAGFGLVSAPYVGSESKCQKGHSRRSHATTLEILKILKVEDCTVIRSHFPIQKLSRRLRKKELRLQREVISILGLKLDKESQAWFLRTAVIERIPFWISCDEGSRVPIWGIDGKNSFICVVQNPFKCSASSKFLLNLSFNCQRISRDCAKLSFPFNQQDDLPTYQNKVVIGLFSQGKALNKKGTYRPSNSNLEIQFPNRRKCLCNRVKAIPQTKVI
ncbi:unnamed protein product [Lepeophtheirus salmonis]|uniref:(salmon louse) hypothetical protein n=1 Tax=Lepeophtheirus salmonis TaxID=72036 RepID=A0A7R8H215_LEPSM|nr:unnamed protein product [Lepeophtheirus salmonis]CAF2819492.1 unnamed protein product [Lepeophtheirus salmonis]